MKKLEPIIARRIIETVGSSGNPPEYGLQYFTAGLDPYINIIKDEYLSNYIKHNGSSFKMVVGVYGGGKTHFLYCIRDLAWTNNFVVSYVSLSPGESPFHKLESVYRAVVKGLMPPLTADELLSGYEQGIQSFIRSWYGTKYQEYYNKELPEDERQELLLAHIDSLQGIESISFAKAVKSAFSCLLNKKEDEFINICQWLIGEGYDRSTHGRFGILQRIDRTTAFPMIRSLVQWIKQIGYSGLVILLDEAERVPSLSSKQREQHLNNLREVIDEVGHANFQSAMIFYAVPDENFLEGRTQVYEALKQRVATVFDMPNPTGVKIELEKTATEPIIFLKKVGEKLKDIYEVAYDYRFDHATSEATINRVAEASYEHRFGDIGYKRLFVQKMIQGLHFLKHKKQSPTVEELQL